MGAKLVHPNKTCINFWGDAAIGFTGMDFETAVRERIPILSCLMNNFSMAIELKVMPVSTEKYRSTDISGNYADMAKAFGGYGERVTDPEPDQGGDPARHRADQSRQAGAAGVHHREGDAGFEVLDRDVAGGRMRPPLVARHGGRRPAIHVFRCGNKNRRGCRPAPAMTEWTGLDRARAA